MPRTLTDHYQDLTSWPHELIVEACDAPGQGNANHLYIIQGYNTASNASDPLTEPDERHAVRLLFQNGPIGEVGPNGVTHETVLAVLIDRLRGFQSGPYACRENALALTKMEEALHWLHHRTRARIARGVEGTHHK